jgi:6-phosphofructokinase 1
VRFDRRDPTRVDQRFSMKIGVLTAGGDCPGLNAVIQAVGQSAYALSATPVGILRGYRGLAERSYRALDPLTVRGIRHLGGTILRTSSFEPHREGAVAGVVEAFERDGFDAVIAVGGEHTMEITRRLYEEEGLPLIGVPKTIDNDVAGTDYTFGFDTAVEIATTAIDRLHTTAQSHDRVMVVEVMGRDTGWIAMFAGIAGAADRILIPEVEISVEEIAEGIDERHRRGKTFSIIVVAEGAKLVLSRQRRLRIQPQAAVDEYGYPRLGGIGSALAHELESRTGFEVRVTVLGHVQRGGSPTATDRILATRYGAKAFDLAVRGEFGRMVSYRGSEITSVPLDEVQGLKQVDVGLLELAHRLFC